MKTYYVYAYLREDGTPYYIGKGKNDRAKRPYGRLTHPPKDRSRIVFWQTGLTEEAAFYFEKAYIKLFGRKDLDTGILHNRSEGGIGGNTRSGKTCSEEHKRKISESCKRTKNSSEGKKIARAAGYKGGITKKNMPSKKNKYTGCKWYYHPVIGNRRFFEAPSDEWTLGLKKKAQK